MLSSEPSTIRRDTEMHGNYKESDTCAYTHVGSNPLPLVLSQIEMVCKYVLDIIFWPHLFEL